MHKSDTNHPNLKLQQKLDILFSWRQGSKVNWDRSLYFDLLDHFGNDHLKLPPVIHVAGTNGKGSIVATLRAILEAQGYRVHAYTSPHLIAVNERIYIAGSYISDEELEGLIDEFWPFIEGKPYSFFEIITAVAFRAFARHPADVLLLEVGCGGRLDCTNVIDQPLSTIISRISMDHTEYLGNTLAEIAAEKAGIMKQNVPCILGYQGEGSKKEEVFEAFKIAAKQVAAIPLFFGTDWSCIRQDDQMLFTFAGQSQIVPLPNLAGEHQIWNTGAAIAALHTIQDTLPVSEEAVQNGLRQITWLARMQKLPAEKFSLPKGYEIWLDAGHNDSAGEILASQIRDWQKQDPKPIHLIVGMLGTKNIGQFLSPFLELASSVRIVPVPGEKGAKTLDDLRNAKDMSGPTNRIMQSEDYQTAIREIAKNEAPCRILITGSAYLAGDILKYLGNSGSYGKGLLENL